VQLRQNVAGERKARKLGTAGGLLCKDFDGTLVLLGGNWYGVGAQTARPARGLKEGRIQDAGCRLGDARNREREEAAQQALVASESLMGRREVVASRAWLISKVAHQLSSGVLLRFWHSDGTIRG